MRNCFAICDQREDIRTDPRSPLIFTCPQVSMQPGYAKCCGGTARLQVLKRKGKPHGGKIKFIGELKELSKRGKR